MPNRASGEGRIAATGREKGSKPDREKEKGKRDEDAERERERERETERGSEKGCKGRQERERSEIHLRFETGREPVDAE